MSDRTGASNPSRGGPRILLSGLAVGAVLGAPIAPIAAVASAGAEETSMAAVEQTVAPDSAAASIRDQFRASFAAGAVTPPEADLTAVICDPS